MKNGLLIFSVLSVLSFKAQTTLYSVNSNEQIDRTSFRQVLQSSGLVILHDKSTSFKNDTAHNFILLVEGNTVKCDWKNKPAKAADVKGELGYLTSDKKIIEQGEKENNRHLKSSYVKGNYIYNSEHERVGYFEGEEMFGVALFLLNNE